MQPDKTLKTLKYNLAIPKMKIIYLPVSLKIEC